MNNNKKFALKKWEQFIKESSEIEFPLKKYLSILKDMIIKNPILIGENLYKLENFMDSKINIYINYKDNIKGKEYKGNLDTINALENEFEFFNIYINISDSTIDRNKLLSVVQHELKHVYDILDNTKEENTFLKNKAINTLKEKYKENNFYNFIHLVYENLRHELDARNAMIYDRFRWLKNYDKFDIEKEFKNTYMYRSLINLQNFNAINFINQFKENELIHFTNDFIEEYNGLSESIKNKEDLKKFYSYWEYLFKKESREYIKKAEKVIDELIKDNTPYMERLSSAIMNTWECFDDELKNENERYLPPYNVEKLMAEKLSKLKNYNP